jgi:hypothetical protein
METVIVIAIAKRERHKKERKTLPLTRGTRKRREQWMGREGVDGEQKRGGRGD